ncbi:conserved exported hypothetical protein [Tenacibaculum sp. 190524A05c]|uniref:hypothetical protein n=1 Tax=Tenacibaculum platacis TaxID=3137852 RepID=UPI0031FBA168
MKTSLLKLLIAPLLIFSCSNNADTETLENEQQRSEHKQAQKSSEEEPNVENTYYEEHLYIYYLESTLAKQYQLKEEYLLKIEEGEEDLIEKLEQLQKEIKENEKTLEFVQIRPVMPKLPPPPVPCPKKTTSCRIPLTNYDFILFNKDIEKVAVKLTTDKGEVISESGELFAAENFEGFPATQINKKGFQGNLILSITKYDPYLEKNISYEVNAYIE